MHGRRLRGTGGRPPKFEVGNSPCILPLIFWKQVMRTDENTSGTTHIMGVVNAFQAKYVPNDEMTKTGCQNILVGK